MSFLNNRIIWSALLSKRAWKKAKSLEATPLVRRKLTANSCDLCHFRYCFWTFAEWHSLHRHFAACNSFYYIQYRYMEYAWSYSSHRGRTNDNRLLEGLWNRYFYNRILVCYRRSNAGIKYTFWLYNPRFWHKNIPFVVLTYGEWSPKQWSFGYRQSDVFAKLATPTYYCASE